MECIPDASTAELPAPDFQDATLVVGVPAVGNVGQLGIDLLILHTAATRCAIIESPDVLPVAGRGAFADQLSAGVTRTTQKDGLVTSLEVFKAEKDGVSCFFLQQRGPVATGRQRAFAKELTRWIEGCGFAQVVLLSSVDAGWRTDQQLQSLPVCASCQNSPAAEVALQDVPPAPTADLGCKASEERSVAPWPLYSECGRAGVPTAMLLAYAADGNNVPEAFLLATASVSALPRGLLDAHAGGSGWCMPPSWRAHVEV